MFTSQKRVPVKKQQHAAIASRLAGSASTGSSTTTTLVSSPSSTRAPVAAVVRARPVVKVATITRTTVVKKAPPPPPPRVVPRPVPAGKDKRRVDGPRRDSPAKSSQAAAARKRSSGKRDRRQSDDDESSVRPGDNSSSEDDDRPAPKRVAPATVVERDVSATLDGETTCIAAESLVAADRSAYDSYFSDPADNRPTSEWAGAEVPTVLLEYPGVNAAERYTLLAPRNSGNEYDPIEDLLSTIRIVLDFFLTPAQSLAVFNHTTATSAFSAFLSAPTSRSGTPSTPSDDTAPTPTLPPLMRVLEKAKAKRDGPAFIAAVERYNDGLRSLKNDGTITTNIREMKGVVEKVWTKITGQVYERAVGPGVELLSKYAAFSSNTYGELLPKFVGEICQLTNLGPNSVFVDLGSGVGNCVVQAALATGCEAWGFENMAHASSLARTQVTEAEARFRMWGLSSGAMKTVEADFCKSPEVGRILQRADVVLVNNEVFSSELNESLSLLFLDLRQDTKVVSLKAFASSFTLSAHNSSSPLAILDQGAQRHYNSKSVSWKGEGGTYFIGRIDRGLLERFIAREKRRAIRAAEREAKASAA